MKKNFSLVLVMLVCAGVWGQDTCGGFFRYSDDHGGTAMVDYNIFYAGKLSDEEFNSIDISEMAKEDIEENEKNGCKVIDIGTIEELSAFQKYCIFKILNDSYPDAKIGEYYSIHFHTYQGRNIFSNHFICRIKVNGGESLSWKGYSITVILDGLFD